MSEIGTKKKKYTKPAFIRIACRQVLLDLIEHAEQDEQLALYLALSIHQEDPEYLGK